MVLFFPGLSAFGAETNGIIHYSTMRELTRLFAHIIPSMALLWYLIIVKKSLIISNKGLVPKREDAISFIWGLPGLIITGAAISALIYLFSSPSILSSTPPSLPPQFTSPQNTIGWIVMVFSCIGAGYLEESFFRFYLLQKLEDWIHFRPVRIIFSIMLFAICHSYEGFWGILNAVLAGLLLSVLYEKYRTLHGIAWAHACYNIFVYMRLFQNFRF